MPKALYLYLKSGRTIYVTDDWDGAEPTEEGMVDGSGVIVGTDGKEVGEPYRDIFRSNAEFAVLAGRNVLSIPGRIDTAESAGGGSGGITASTYEDSDEVAHVAPRQHYRVYTWLVFEDTDGAPFKVRKAIVDAWGSQPPIE